MLPFFALALIRTFCTRQIHQCCCVDNAVLLIARQYQRRRRRRAILLLLLFVDDAARAQPLRRSLAALAAQHGAHLVGAGLAQHGGGTWRRRRRIDGIRRSARRLPHSFFLE